MAVPHRYKRQVIEFPSGLLKRRKCSAPTEGKNDLTCPKQIPPNPQAPQRRPLDAVPPRSTSQVLELREQTARPKGQWWLFLQKPVGKVFKKAQLLWQSKFSILQQRV